MDKKEWIIQITEAAKAAGTYQVFFDAVIDTLADILAKRDAAQKAFEDSGCELVVEHTNKGGATNIEQNPALRVITVLNRDALAYWRDLGAHAGRTEAPERIRSEDGKEKRNGS